MPPSRLSAAMRTRLHGPQSFVSRVTVALTLLAFAFGALVLALDLWPGFLTSPAHRVISATPLLAIAVGYLVLQIRLRPPAHELLKRALLSVAFIFWSASQLDPTTGWAPVAGDVAIALFVLDLGLIIWDELHPGTTHSDSPAHASECVHPLHELRACTCCGGVECACRRAS